ncbi:DUF6538 domain-containing protein [Flavivirga abyssicola]|uniref:DUF6538 domain-containing protein n=1 Tax=Flavivirga abyssicola TaxID=3063533 RepID=UPI0026DF87A0|nr:DUF6538 domain-containing protein [Flavivirga sp. MEBiC07777]WVK15097.1 DUF6538 domain-containing protein [Flavivirga sp. MEBiC07777]
MSTKVVTRTETKMIYLLNRNGWYFYDRRVPQRYSMFDPRCRVRESLNTQCKKTAIKKAVAANNNMEGYWNSLVQNNEQHSPLKFKQLMMTARQLGFTYHPTNKIAELSLLQLIERVLTAKGYINKEINVKAVLGTEKQQETIQLSEALKRFWDYSKPSLLNKNRDQQRKWKNPRKKAVNNFIKYVGNKNISDITNLDLIKFRDGWLERMKKDNIKADTVNKDFTHLKGVLETVSTHEQLDLNIENIFKKIHIKETDKQTRKAYSTEFIKEKILNHETLKTLDEEAKNILYVCVNTGARPIEIVNLVKEDIILDEPIPYIHIRPRQGYSLKTKESERKLPLAGIALEAFKSYPNGFIKYRGSSEKTSANINNWLSKNNLRPTQKHSLYSLRHSFQDRLTALDVKDRVQCQLMGHKFNRSLYGGGATLEHLYDIMKEVSL